MSGFKHTSVLVALSGGVDSAVSALRLAQMGYKIIGITFKLWEFSVGRRRRNNLCCSDEGISAAQGLCRMLGCEHIVRDVSEQFYEDVIRNFISEYRFGRTPSPCVVCNPRIKWHHLIAEADKLGIEKVATGHYARTLYSPISIGERSLLRGADAEKDQSYFLYRLSAEQLARTLFPVGHLSKWQTRAIAELANLPVSSSRESQELCFLPDCGLEVFLQKFLPEAAIPGKIVDTSGKIVGEHNGIAFYTIGQRSGLGGGFAQPMYVKRIIANENKIVIGTREEIYWRCFSVKDIVWRRISDGEFYCTVRIRHRHKDSPAKVLVKEGYAEVIFDEPQRAISPGQSAVFYDAKAVIGGGIIEDVKN